MADYPDRLLYVRGKCVCVYCGFDGTTGVLAWHQLVIDHVIPLRCKPSERKKSPLNVEVNKVVACLKCNDVKRAWDKKYDDAIPVSPSPERVARARQSATEHIRKYYAGIDTDFEPMTNEIDIAASADEGEGIRQGLEDVKEGHGQRGSFSPSLKPSMAYVVNTTPHAERDLARLYWQVKASIRIRPWGWHLVDQIGHSQSYPIAPRPEEIWRTMPQIPQRDRCVFCRLMAVV